MLVVRSTRVVLPEGERSAALHIRDGVIERIVEYASDDPTGARVFNAADLVVSPGLATDHSPAPGALRTPGDFIRAWSGIASLELSLPAVWTRLRAFGASAGQAAPSGASTLREPQGRPEQGRGATRQARSVNASPALADLARWMSAAPAALAGLGERKGRIAPGFDADLVVWDPDADFVVDPARLHQRHKLTPYAGRSLFGTVVTTFVRGERVWDQNRLVRAYGGRLL